LLPLDELASISGVSPTNDATFATKEPGDGSLRALQRFNEAFTAFYVRRIKKALNDYESE
jgi:hypothetical protein